LGESEKLVRCLFEFASALQPSIVFIDEIDSILTSRSTNEHEASRRLKTEFLLRFDGLTSDSSARVALIGATNRPEELDEAALRRLAKKIFIPLPGVESREAMIKRLLENQHHDLTDTQIHQLAVSTEGYSGSDITGLCREAALGPIRCVGLEALKQIKSPTQLPPISFLHFQQSLTNIRPSVSPQCLTHYEQWTAKHGTS